MNDYNLVIDAIQKYINEVISFNELETLFYKYFVDSDYDFSEKQACILDDVHNDIELFTCEWGIKDKNYNKKAKFKNFLKKSLNLLNE